MSDDETTLAERWAALARLTPARIGLGRASASLPTREVLRFGLAHAQARDAVQVPLRVEQVADQLSALAVETVCVESAATSRELYLRRPDLGRHMSPASHACLAGQRGAFDLALVLADGLSSTAIHRNAAPFLAALLPALACQRLRLAPVTIACQARVALGDEIGQVLGARLACVLIGERPGLSSPDSLGAYLTFAPKVGIADAARNCISNIRPGGLSYEEAAFKLSWLIREALRRSLTGVGLKDESDGALGAAGSPGAVADHTH